jgi:hypothetical protein
MEARHIVETHPEAACHAAYMHAAEQHAAEMRAGQRPYLPLLAAYTDVPQSHQGARRYAEENPDIVNRSARCVRLCGDTDEAFCERCTLGAEAHQSFYHPSDYHHPMIRQPCYSDQSRAAQDPIWGPRPICGAYLPEFPHAIIRDIPPYRGPVLMGTTCAPGRDGHLHYENCSQAQAEPYCRCRDCDDRRRGLLGSPTGSYERARANSAREV